MKKNTKTNLQNKQTRKMKKNNKTNLKKKKETKMMKKNNKRKLQKKMKRQKSAACHLQKKMLKEKLAACHHQLGDHEALVSEIMSRLSVKSLMRFKCVCKRWQYIICKDDYFIDLHLSRSKATHTCSLLHVRQQHTKLKTHFYTAEVFLPSERKVDGRVQLRNICQWNLPNTPTHRHHICTLDGLICFMDIKNCCARIYNSSTREIIPWIETTIKQVVIILQSKRLLQHVFGYCHATKEYKVLALWKLSDDLVCEVMTVRQNSWRRINRIPSVSTPSSYTLSNAVYVNGFIYLLCTQRNNGLAQTIVEFNVSSEKFRIIDTVLVCYNAYLMELDGRLCMFTYDALDKTCKSIKMYILYNHGDHVQDKKSKMMTINSSSTTIATTSAAGSINYYWVEETLSLPHSAHTNSIRQIPWTNLFIVGSMKVRSPCHYIWNNESGVITLDSIENYLELIHEPDNYVSRFHIFVPNLWRVN